MSIEHIQLIHDELPHLFQPRDFPAYWAENFIFEPIVYPDRAQAGGAYARKVERFGAAQIEPGAHFSKSSQVLSDTLSTSHAGAPIPYGEKNKTPPADCLAFYLPFHYFYPSCWGVYLLLDGVVWLAGEIIKRSGGTVGRLQAMRAARTFLYYHEAFHYRTECFASRLELTHREPLYTTGFELLYRTTFMMISCREEGLANASALIQTDRNIRSAAVNRALEGYVQDSAPGYDQGVRIRADFVQERCTFAEENQKICLPLISPKKPEVWRMAPHLFDGITNIKRRVKYVIPRGSPIAAHLPFRPPCQYEYHSK